MILNSYKLWYVLIVIILGVVIFSIPYYQKYSSQDIPPKNVFPEDHQSLPVINETNEKSDRYYQADLNNNSVIFKEGNVSGADVATFQALGEGYAKDKNFAYFAGEKIKGADSVSFAVIESPIGPLGRDKNSVYFGQNILGPNSLNIDNIEMGEEVIKAGNKVFIDSGYGWITEIEGADRATFEYIEVCGCVEKSCGHYYKDKNAVFGGSDEIPGIDPKSFIFIVSFSDIEGMFRSSSYAKDTNHVYIGCGNILEGADPDSFAPLNEFGYARDSKHIYFWNRIIAAADLLTFEIVSELYAKDRYNVFKFGEVIEGADPVKCTKDLPDNCEK